MAKDFYLASAPFVSGVAWLVNILLELGIRCDHPAHENGGWINNGGGGLSISGEALNHLKHDLPVLAEKESFPFDGGVRITWGHRLDFAAGMKPVILFVRDPRDAIYASHTRSGSSISYEDYLKTPAYGADHFPDCFYLPPADTWAYFNLFWLNMKKFVPINVIKFESMRSDPVEDVGRILDCLGVTRAKDEIVRAVQASASHRVHAAGEVVKSETGGEFFDGPAAYVMKLLEYECRNEAAARLNSASLFSCLTEEAKQVVLKADAAIAKGYVLAAFMPFRKALAIEQRADNAPGIAFISNRMSAAYWAYSIFRNSKDISSQAHRVYEIFHQQNEQFIFCKQVQSSFAWYANRMVKSLAEADRTLDHVRLLTHNMDDEGRLTGTVLETRSDDPVAYAVAASIMEENGEARAAWALSHISLRCTQKRKKLPNVVFCNLTNSGSSAIDPILREMLSPLGYDIVQFGPETTSFLPFVIDLSPPIYHWTHGDFGFFKSLAQRGDFRFLYLYRDIRDVVVSLVKDSILQNKFPQATERDIMKYIIEKLDGWMRRLEVWMNVDSRICFKFSFEEMKKDIPGMMKKIFGFLEIAPDEDRLLEMTQKWSFEAVTKRQRGEEGSPVRTKYYFRKGISGDWRNHFDEEMKDKFKKELVGKYLIALGYEADDNW